MEFLSRLTLLSPPSSHNPSLGLIPQRLRVSTRVCHRYGSFCFLKASDVAGFAEGLSYADTALLLFFDRVRIRVDLNACSVWDCPLLYSVTALFLTLLCSNHFSSFFVHLNRFIMLHRCLNIDSDYPRALYLHKMKRYRNNNSVNLEFLRKKKLRSQFSSE